MSHAPQKSKGQWDLLMTLDAKRWLLACGRILGEALEGFPLKGNQKILKTIVKLENDQKSLFLQLEGWQRYFYVIINAIVINYTAYSSRLGFFENPFPLEYYGTYWADFSGKWFAISREDGPKKKNGCTFYFTSSKKVISLSPFRIFVAEENDPKGYITFFRPSISDSTNPQQITTFALKGQYRTEYSFQKRTHFTSKERPR